MCHREAERGKRAAARFYHGIVAQYSVSYVPFLTAFLF
ncbi:hypothetical protein KKH3_16540 [Pectobacterium actinidiae]|nr:hypothetical protein KKH3_16540 [Pectobacterium actinidiae]